MTLEQIIRNIARCHPNFMSDELVAVYVKVIEAEMARRTAVELTRVRAELAEANIQVGYERDERVNTVLAYSACVSRLEAERDAAVAVAQSHCDHCSGGRPTLHCYCACHASAAVERP